MSSQKRRLPLTRRFGLIILVCLVGPVAILLTYLNLSIGDSFRQSVADGMQVRRDSLLAWFDTENRELGNIADFIRSDQRSQDYLGQYRGQGPSREAAWWQNLAVISGTSLIRVNRNGSWDELGRVGGQPPDLGRQVAAWTVSGNRSHLLVDGGRVCLVLSIPLDGSELVLVRQLDFSTLAWLRDQTGTGLSILDLSRHDTVFSTFPDLLAHQMAASWLGLADSPLPRGGQSLAARWQGLGFNSLGFELPNTARARIVAVIAAPDRFNPMVDITVPIMMVAVIIILMILVFSFLMARIVIGPVLSLSYAVDSLRLHLRQRGPLISIPVRQNDEIGDLALAINELGQELGNSSDKIAEQRSEIIAYTHSLEERVQERTREAEEARLRAEIANQHKSKFLVNMNHELRTPLNAISGITDLLRYGAYEKHEDVGALLERLLDLPALAGLPEERRRDISLAIGQLTSDSGGSRALIALLRHGLVQDSAQLPEGGAAEIEGLLAECLALVDEQERQTLKAYSNIHDAAVSLLGIIDEVINLSRIESGVINIEPTRVRLADLVASCMVHAEAYAQYHGKLTDFEISRSIDPNLPEYVWLDAGKIKQVLLNLLTNAVKYTDRGQVQLSLDMQVEDSRTILHCAVRDSGRGISDKDRAVMFMEFGRAFEVREIEGTGLGLALSKKLIERHGGAMGFISELGRGSTFWFTVPLVVDSLQA